jgi:hypothetical protein
LCLRVAAGEEGTPPEQERAALLYDGWLLDVPKLLDLAALYGPSNPGLLRRMMSAVRRGLPAAVSACTYSQHMHACKPDLQWPCQPACTAHAERQGLL